MIRFRPDRRRDRLAPADKIGEDQYGQPTLSQHPEAIDAHEPRHRLALGDSMDLLRSLPSASVDMVATDPPYGTTNLTWDKAPDWGMFLGELKRVTKPGGWLIIFSQQPVATDVIMAGRRLFRYQIVWEKTMAVGFLDCNRRPLRAHELILVFRANGPKGVKPTYHPQMGKGEPYSAKRKGCRSAIYGAQKGCWSSESDNHGTRYPRDVLQFPLDKSSERFHPTQKPTKLMRWLIETYSNPGDTVLDPFCGSGTSIVAAHQTSRIGIGFDISPQYLQVAANRLSGAIASSSNPGSSEMTIAGLQEIIEEASCFQLPLFG